MSFKKFFTPYLVTLLLLSSVWLAGIDQVYVDNDLQVNLQKYSEVQRQIAENYVNETDLTSIYKSSIVGMAESLSDDSIELEGTPLDTTLSGLNVTSIVNAITRFEEAYLFIANNYPDENMTRLTEEAIRGMLNNLDPHSVYIEPEDSEQIQEEFAGRFQGVGIQFDILQDTITVVTPISGGPSEQLGIMSGDRIIMIEDSSAVGYTEEQVISRLRGPKGTEVTVSIKRPNISNILDFTIVRDDIPLVTLDTGYMLDERTGYLKINRFAATTHSEFMTAAEQLRERGMERMVLDLRNNPGGYLSQAIAIAEEFFPRGTRLVSTESRHARYTDEYRSGKNGIYRDVPIIVLVNEGSASASEIVSGAIQDHDRGLIVGRRTFGKGLVQQQYELADRSNIRVTISKYLTPSGRLIQKPYDNGRESYVFEIHERDGAVTDIEQYLDHLPDSLRYSTLSGRTVYGGGGIVPDHIVQEDTTVTPLVLNFVMANRVDFDFIREYLDQEGDAFRNEWGDDYEAFRSEFSWTDEQKAHMVELIEEKGLIISDEVEEPEIRNDSLVVSRQDIESSLWMTEGRTKAELARQVWGLEFFFPVINDEFNTSLHEAMKLWEEVNKLETMAARQVNISPGLLPR